MVFKMLKKVFIFHIKGLKYPSCHLFLCASSSAFSLTFLPNPTKRYWVNASIHKTSISVNGLQILINLSLIHFMQYLYMKDLRLILVTTIYM